MANRRYEHVAD